MLMLSAAERLADSLLEEADLQARFIHPSHRPPMPSRVALVAVCHLALLGELFHPIRTGDRDYDQDNDPH